MHYLAHRLGKLKPKTDSPGGNTLRRLRFDLGCNGIVRGADTRMVKDHVGSTNTLYPSMKCGPVLLHYVVEDM